MHSKSFNLGVAAAKFAKLRASGKLARLVLVLCSAIVGVWLALGWLSTSRGPSVDVESAISAYWVTQSIRGADVQQGLEGHSRPAGYTLVLTTLAFLTPGTLADMKCWVDNPRTCASGHFTYVIAVQLLVAALIMLLAYRLARRLSGSTEIALIAMMLTLFAMRTGEFAGIVRAAIWFQFFLLLHFWFLVEAVHRRSLTWALAAGCAAGLFALFEPLALLIVPLSAVQLHLALSQDADHSPPFAPVLFSASVLAASIVTAGGLLYILAIHSYDTSAMMRHLGLAFGQRVAFNGLDPSTWLLGMVAPIPWLGDFFMSLVPLSEARKLSVGAVPGSLVDVGTTTIFADAVARTGGDMTSAIQLLVRERVLEQPIAYALSLPPVLARGLFAGGGIIALIGLFHMRRMLQYARVQDQIRPLLLVVVPVFGLLILNTLLTSNEFWLNPMLPFIYAYAIAYVSGGW